MSKFIITGITKGTFNMGNPITTANLLPLGGGESVGGDFLPIAGGTMTGPIKLAKSWSDSVLSLNSIYVDETDGGFGFGVGTTVSTWFSKSGTTTNRVIDVYNDGSRVHILKPLYVKTIQPQGSDGLGLYGDFNDGTGRGANIQIGGNGSAVITATIGDGSTDLDGQFNITNRSAVTLGAVTLTNIGSFTWNGNEVATQSWVTTQAYLPLSGGTMTGNTLQGINTYTEYGGNTTWGAKLRVGGNGYTAGRVETTASVVTTNGNLHIDAGATKTTIINYYSGTDGVKIGNGNSGYSGAEISATGNYTGNGFIKIGGTSTQFLKANGTVDSTDYLPLTGGLMSGNIERSTSISGYQVGSYDIANNGTHSNPIYTIGTSYKPALTTLGNMYGIGYTNTSASFITAANSGSMGGSGWGMYVASGGIPRIWLNAQDGTGHFKGSIYSNGIAVALSDHTHSEYATTSHTHSEYAVTSHTHAHIEAQHAYINSSVGIGHGTFKLNMETTPAMYVVGRNSQRKVLFSNGLTQAPLAQVEVIAGAAASPALIAKGISAQTANIFEVRRSDDTTPVVVNSGGTLISSYSRTFNPASITKAVGGIHLTPIATTNDLVSSITFSGQPNLSTEAQAGIYVQGSSTYGTKMVLATTNNHSTGPIAGLSIDHLGAVVMRGNVSAPDFVGTSDRTLKENIQILTPEPINSNYKTFNFIGEDQHRVGVIAQELEIDHPEFVRTNEDGIKSVSYNDLHSAEIAYLKSMVKDQENKIKHLESLIEKLINDASTNG